MFEWGGCLPFARSDNGVKLSLGSRPSGLGEKVKLHELQWDQVVFVGRERVGWEASRSTPKMYYVAKCLFIHLGYSKELHGSFKVVFVHDISSLKSAKTPRSSYFLPGSKKNQGPSMSWTSNSRSSTSLRKRWPTTGRTWPSALATWAGGLSCQTFFLLTFMVWQNRQFYLIVYLLSVFMKLS